VISAQGPVSRKSRKLFGPEKPFVKLRPVYSVKLIFSHVVKGMKIKITAKFRALRRIRFEDTKRIMSPEMRPKVLEISRNGPQESVSRMSRNFLGDPSPFLSSRRIRFKPLHLAVVLPFLISETYRKSSFSRQAGHSLKNCLSGRLVTRSFEKRPPGVNTCLERIGRFRVSHSLCLKASLSAKF